MKVCLGHSMWQWVMVLCIACIVCMYGCDVSPAETPEKSKEHGFSQLRELEPGCRVYKQSDMSRTCYVIICDATDGKSIPAIACAW